MTPLKTSHKVLLAAAGFLLATALIVALVVAQQLSHSGSRADSQAGDQPGTTSSTTPAPAYAFPYQPLWPFADQSSAEKWLSDQQPSDKSAWQSDASATALRFTREFLGFTDFDRTTSVTVNSREAWVTVGQSIPDGEPTTAAKLHLARLGPADNAPWEVVGTEDTDLTLDTPAYGSPFRPVLDVGGTISGVDESLEVQARQGSKLLGEFCCQPAGGQGSRWSIPLTMSTPQPGAVTVVVSTGGHLSKVERFAITALRVD